MRLVSDLSLKWFSVRGVALLHTRNWSFQSLLHFSIQYRCMIAFKYCTFNTIGVLVVFAMQIIYFASCLWLALLVIDSWFNMSLFCFTAIANHNFEQNARSFGKIARPFYFLIAKCEAITALYNVYDFTYRKDLQNMKDLRIYCSFIRIDVMCWLCWSLAHKVVSDRLDYRWFVLLYLKSPTYTRTIFIGIELSKCIQPITNV